MRALPLLATALLLAGCTTTTPAPHHDASPGLHAVCGPGARLPALGTGICTQTLAPVHEREREASIAVHPTDPNTVLATWRNGNFSTGPRIEAAYTRDGGATWTFTQLHDPSLGSLPMAMNYSYDSVARFGPDGTAYVLYGGEYRFYGVNQGGVRAVVVPEDRMTLASSKDGAHWVYHAFSEYPANTVGVDRMDLAVEPDTGRLVVIAGAAAGPPVASLPPGPVYVSEGIWAWTSDDGGATWSSPVIAISNAGNGLLTYHSFQSLSAGPGGLVLLNTAMVDEIYKDNTLHGTVTVSRDGGKTWGAPQPVFDYAGHPGDSLLNEAASTWQDAQGVHAALVYGDAGRVVGLRSDDGARTWGKATELVQYPQGMAHVWLGASARNGSVWAAYRWGSDDPARFGAGILRWTGGDVQNLTVADWPVKGAWKVGDDWGSVAPAADGSAWMAFSDGENGGERIRVAHAAP